MNEADSILAKIVNWGEKEEAIRALILEGSRAFGVPVDELADFDVNVFTKTHEPYTQDDRWLSTIGEVWVYIPEKYERRSETIPTRLVIFKGGVKVDFSFVKADMLAEFTKGDGLATLYKTLLDKDGATDKLPTFALTGLRHDRPAEKDFLSLVNEYWFEAYHVAKYLKRDELWLVKSRDWTTKTLLLKLIEWHAQAQHQWACDTQHVGKHMKSWVEGTVWESLHDTFPRFDRDDSWKGLLASIDLFRRLATETAEALGFAYPHDVDRNITSFILSIKD